MRSFYSIKEKDIIWHLHNYLIKKNWKAYLKWKGLKNILHIFLIKKYLTPISYTSRSFHYEENSIDNYGSNKWKEG